MIHDPDEFPDPKTLPDQRELILGTEWDCLVVFDACRLDAFRNLIGSAEAVRTPGNPLTAYWVSNVWGTGDWSDLTYVSGNSVTGVIDIHDDLEGDLEDWVDTYIKTYESRSPHSCYDKSLRTTVPDQITGIAKEQDPPVVVHYNQPHTPFIGTLALNIADTRGYERLCDAGFIDNPDRSGCSIYRVAEYIDDDLLRHAYLENLRIAASTAATLEEEFDNVVYTADHGELLGPDQWGHGHPGDPRNTVVPWRAEPYGIN